MLKIEGVVVVLVVVVVERWMNGRKTDGRTERWERGDERGICVKGWVEEKKREGQGKKEEGKSKRVIERDRR
jgi:hypothetical protein